MWDDGKDVTVLLNCFDFFRTSTGAGIANSYERSGPGIASRSKRAGCRSFTCALFMGPYDRWEILFLDLEAA
eukprot:2479217-Rhodomonas_salina.1